MSQLFRNTVQMACPQCGSHNVEVRNTMPSGKQGMGGKVMDWLKELSSLSGPGIGIPMGKKFIVCKDCGKTSMAMFN